MFTVDCPRHGGVVLIWPSGIDGIVNRDGRIEVHYHCTCGHRDVWITGRAMHHDAAPSQTVGATSRQFQS
jgi:hypothetical protein